MYVNYHLIHAFFCFFSPSVLQPHSKKILGGIFRPSGEFMCGVGMFFDCFSFPYGVVTSYMATKLHTGPNCLKFHRQTAQYQQL